MDDVRLVPMNPLHLPAVLAIERRVFTSPWSGEMFRQEIRGVFGSRAVAAVLGENVVGYCIAWFIEEEVHLVNIAVSPPYQERGIGTLLLSDLVHAALVSARELITLEVRESNVQAQAFYRRFLFRPVGIRKGYYSDNLENALLMVLDLDDVENRGGLGAETSHVR